MKKHPGQAGVIKEEKHIATYAGATLAQLLPFAKI